MQLKLTTDHAIRALLYLAKSGTDCSSPEIAEEMHISLNYLRCTLPYLLDAGLIVKLRGPSNGYRLVRDPKRITLYEVMNAMDDSVAISESLPLRDAADDSPLDRYYCKLQKAMNDCLRCVTIDDILHQERIPDIIALTTCSLQREDDSDTEPKPARKRSGSQKKSSAKPRAHAAANRRSHAADDTLAGVAPEVADIRLNKG